MSAPVNLPPEEPVRLPFEPFTLLVALSYRGRAFALSALLALALALAVGGLAGDGTYEAEAVLLHNPPPPETTRGIELPSLDSMAHMVKIRPNLERVIQSLGLPSTPAELGKACTVRVQKDTQLLSIKVNWKDADLAARIANALQEAFLLAQQSLTKEGLSRQYEEIQAQIDRAVGLRDAALEGQSRFRREKQFIDLELESKVLLEESADLEVMLEEARIERGKTLKQKDGLRGIVQDIENRVASEREAMKSNENLRDVNLRVERLRDAIRDDRETREKRSELTRLEVEYRRAVRLHEKGLITPAQLLEAKTAWERQQAVATDTPQISEWKRQIDELDRTLMPEAETPAPSASILHEMLLRSFSLELDAVSVEDRVTSLGEALARVRRRLEGLPAIAEEAARLASEVRRWENALDQLQAPLMEARRARDARHDHFLLVAAALPSPAPLRPMRGLIGLVTALGAFLLLGAAIVARELLHARVRSARELASLLRAPAHRWSGAGAEVDDPSKAARQLEEDLLHSYDLVRKWLERQEGATFRLRVTAAAEETRTGPVVDEILAQLIMMGRRVARVQLAPVPGELPAAGPGALEERLGAWLNGRGPSGPPPLPLIDTAGVLALDLTLVSRAPHLAGSARFRELLDRIAGQVDVLIVEGVVRDPADAPRRSLEGMDLHLVVATADLTRHAAVRASRLTGTEAGLRQEGLLIGERCRFQWLEDLPAVG